MQKQKLFKTELMYNFESEGKFEIDVKCTEIFKSLVEDSGTEKELSETIDKITEALKEYMRLANGKMAELEKESLAN